MFEYFTQYLRAFILFFSLFFFFYFFAKSEFANSFSLFVIDSIGSHPDLEHSFKIQGFMNFMPFENVDPKILRLSNREMLGRGVLS